MTITISNKQAQEAIELVNAIESWTDCDATLEELSQEMIERIVTDNANGGTI